MNLQTSMDLRLAEAKPHVLCRYAPVAQKLFQSELGEYRTYGICAEGSSHPDMLCDVSTCEETVLYIVEHLNRHRVSPLHFRDVVADLLSQREAECR